MILHVVLFDPRPQLTDTDRERFIAALREAFATMSTVRAAHVRRSLDFVLART